MERDFKAVFNPYNKQLFVKYGVNTEEHQFQDLCEWTKVWHDNNNDFLHIHLDYDEFLQLIFYYVPVEETRRNNCSYTDCQAWNSIRDKENYPEVYQYITIVNSDEEYKKEVLKIKQLKQ